MQVQDPAPGNGARGSADARRADLPPPPGPPPPRPAGDYSRPGTGEYARVSTAAPDYGPPSRPGGLGLGGEGLRLEPPAPAPRRRLPELVLGIFLVAGCALAAVLLAVAGRERTPALALAGDLHRGDVLSEDDLDTVYIGSDSQLAFLDPDQASDIVGQAALSELPAGTLVIPEQFAHPDTVLAAGDASIGLALDEGQLPSLNLAPGDQVKVVAGNGTGQGAAQVVADGATVESVTEIQDEPGAQARWRVALRLSENDATNLAMALASNAQIQLVMVER
jgi:hypothetical protein